MSIDSAAEVIRRAVAQASIPGPDDVLAERLDSLAMSLDERGGLTDVGRRLVADEVIRSVHLRHHCLKGDTPGEASVSAAGSQRLLVVCGLPRTGSTALHRMMAHYPGVAGIDLAKGLAAFATPEDQDGRARRRLSFLAMTAPSFVEGHPMNTTEVEECLVPLVAAGCYASLDLLTDAPGAGIDEMSADARRRTVTEYLGAVLPHLVSHQATVTVLKSPLHSMWLSELRRAAPQAQFVVLERDLEQVIASWISLVADPVKACRVDPDIGRLAKSWLKRWAEVRADLLGYREEESFMTISHDQLRRESAATASQVAEWMGVGSEAVEIGERAVRDWLVRHPPARFGARPYTLQATGLSAEDVKDATRSHGSQGSFT